MSSITVIDNLALDDTATSDDTSTVGEPSVGLAGDSIFVTGNWYASRSSDNGANWTHVDPFTTLPSAAGGFCCDQVTLHDARRGVWIWILQYIERNGANVFRIAAARDADFAGGGWYWWDVAPTSLDSAWSGLWFDYPDAALSDGNLYVTFNLFDASDRWQRAAAMRFPLDAIAEGASLGVSWWSTTEFGSLRLTQGAGRTMYWGSHRSANQLRLFRWVDGGTTVSWWDVAVRQWSDAISSNAPNGVDWLARTDPRVTGGCVGGGVVTFDVDGRRGRPPPARPCPCRAHPRVRQAGRRPAGPVEPRPRLGLPLGLHEQRRDGRRHRLLRRRGPQSGHGRGRPRRWRGHVGHPLRPSGQPLPGRARSGATTSRAARTIRTPPGGWPPATRCREGRPGWRSSRRVVHYAFGLGVAVETSQTIERAIAALPNLDEVATRLEDEPEDVLARAFPAEEGRTRAIVVDGVGGQISEADDALRERAVEDGRSALRKIAATATTRRSHRPRSSAPRRSS